MIYKCDIIDEAGYARISEEKGLEPTCPILNRCERRIETIYAHSFKKTEGRDDKRKETIERLEKAFIPNNDKINIRGNNAYSFKHDNFASYRYMCPEVSLFDKDYSIIHNIAASAFEWDKLSDYHGDMVITECKHYSDCLEFKQYQHEEKIKNNNTSKLGDLFINQDRIDSLNKTESDFDLKKLIKICEELNSNYINENYLSTSMLGRTLLDHIPPIFELDSFNAVANNYGTKSFKKSMQHLQNSLRNIADGYLHSPIRRKESLPNKTQIDFRADLDVLLAEIIRVLN